MDANHQKNVGNKLIVTDDNLWIPPLSPKDQRKVDRLQKKRMKANNKWRWGFSNKTGWEWLQLLLQLLTALALPVALFLATQWFSVQQNAQQAVANSVQTRNQQQETTYQAYLDRMSDLIENGKLADPHSSTALRALAQSQTFAALRRADAIREGYIIQFLRDAGLLGQPKPIVNLGGANLSGANLSGANLGGADLSRINLSGADLSRANLDGANLSRANLNGANLSRANLTSTNLYTADLGYADLSGADLINALVTKEQLAQAASLIDATMPDGLKHP